MNIALVGYGQMGHMIHACAEKAGHKVVLTADVMASDASFIIPSEDSTLAKKSLAEAIKNSGAEGIIEFSHPSAVVNNIVTLLPLKLPMVVGTTGWKDKEAEVASYAASCGGTLMRSANFSVGVNMFYRIVEEAVKLMDEYAQYDVSTWEAHHVKKADSPSGTALEIARRIIANSSCKTDIVVDAFHEKPQPHQLHVSSTRVGSVPGTHKVFFDSAADTIELTHTARSREGFAQGAVEALSRLKKALDTGALKPGALYGMEDLF